MKTQLDQLYCLDCSTKHCLVCPNNTSCNLCNESAQFYLSADSSCQFCDQTNGYYLTKLATVYECYKCLWDNCATCNISHCIKCNQNYDYYLYEDGFCRYNCQEAQSFYRVKLSGINYCNKCPQSFCERCANSTWCSLCATGYTFDTERAC